MILPRHIRITGPFTTPRLFCAAITLLLWCGLLFADKAAAETNSTEVFGLGKVHRFQIEISEDHYKAMQPASQGAHGFPPKAPSSSPAATPAVDVHRSGFNEFRWVRVLLSTGGRTYTNAAIRYKGHFTYGASQGLLKRSLKIDLEHYGGEDRFGPLKKITLNAGILDPSRGRETLAFAAFRDATVPASRTAYAEVSLTVPGQYDHVYLGLFTLVEDVDKAFLKDHFGDTNGLLMKPEGVRGIEYLGEDWQAYKSRLKPDRDATSEEQKVIMALARLVEEADNAEFRQKIGEYLDIDEFLRYLAVSVMLVNLDSPLAMPQNFFVYLPEKTKKLVFLPWDLDLSFAAWPMGGPAEQQMNLSLIHPYTGEHKLIQRLLADDKTRARYLAIVQSLTASHFNEATLTGRIEHVESAIKQSLEKEAKALTARNELGATRQAGQIASRAPSLRQFATKRPASIQAQIKNPKTGYVPRGMRF